MTRALPLLAALACLPTALSGCDCGSGIGGCGATELSAFDGLPALDVPATLTYGEPAAVTAAARFRVGGTGLVQLVSGVERLRVLAPVADTVDFGVGSRVTTEPVRVAFASGETARVRWQIAVDDLDGPGLLTPQLNVAVALDSVRTADGRLVALRSDDGGISDDACRALVGAPPDRPVTCSGGIIDRLTGRAVPVSLRP